MRTRRCFTVAIVAAGLVHGCGEENTVSGTSEDGPKVVAMSPAPGHAYIAADQGFAVEFSHPMDPSSVEDAYRVSTSRDAVRGHFRWSDDGTAMVFSPEEHMTPGQEVRVRWAEGMHSSQGVGVTDGDGAPLAGFEFTCTVYAPPSTFATNGERIYFTATSASGEPITYQMGHDFQEGSMPGYGTMGTALMGMMGGGAMGGMGMGMEGGQDDPAGGVYGMACASCHGPDGSGGRYLAMGTVRAPSIRAEMLAAAEADEDGHGHEPYDDDALATAITAGLDPEGEMLNGFMPRWTMSDQDLADLMQFLKGL